MNLASRLSKTKRRQVCQPCGPILNCHGRLLSPSRNIRTGKWVRPTLHTPLSSNFESPAFFVLCSRTPIGLPLLCVTHLGGADLSPFFPPFFYIHFFGWNEVGARTMNIFLLVLLLLVSYIFFLCVKFGATRCLFYLLSIGVTLGSSVSVLFVIYFLKYKMVNGQIYL